MIFLQLLINSLIAGAIYALVATGYTLVYATNRLVHFAHGAVVTASAYFFFTFWSLWGWPPVAAVAATLAAAGALGAVLYYGIYFPLMRRKAAGVILLIASLALLVLLQNLLLLLYGADVKTFDVPRWREGVEIYGAIITYLQLIIVGVVAVLLPTVYLAMKYTAFGKRIRAVSDNPELAHTSGINVPTVQLAGLVAASLLAGVAGILVGLEQNIEPYMGVQLIIKGYTGAVIGGIPSLPGAVLGSFLVGAAENFGIWYLPSGYKDAIAFVLLLGFLLVRPQGILGINKGIRQ